MIDSYSHLRPIGVSHEPDTGFFRLASFYLISVTLILIGEGVLFLGLHALLAARVQDATVYAWALLTIANLTLWVVLLARSLKDS